MRKKLKDVEGITPYDMIAHLPMECCFFDSRHHIVGGQVLPFAVTTRIGANNQQYLFEIYETDNAEVRRQGWQCGEHTGLCPHDTSQPDERPWADGNRDLCL